MVNIINNGATCDLTDHAGEIDGRNMELVGIERDVSVLYKVARQQTDEADEDFLHALGRLAVYDGTLLGVLQVEQEYPKGHNSATQAKSGFGFFCSFAFLKKDK